MLSPKPEAVEKYQSLCPGYKRFAVVEEYELPNFPGWDVLKIFITKEEVSDLREGISIDVWNCVDATQGTAGTIKEKQPHYHKKKVIEVRKYLIGYKEVDLIDKLSKELMEKEKLIRDLMLKQIQDKQEYRGSMALLNNEIDAYRARASEREHAAEVLSDVARRLAEKIKELETELRGHNIVFGEAVEIKPAIRHLDLDD